MALKILVSGDVDGHFRQLFTRVSTVIKKNGPFEKVGFGSYDNVPTFPANSIYKYKMLLCIGSFFANKEEFEPYLNGSLKVPIQTFILGPNTPDHVHMYSTEDGAELCPNLTYLGKRGVFRTSSGMKIVYMSGVEDAELDSDSKIGAYCLESSEMDALVSSLVAEKNFKGVDLLLTSSWPKGVTKYAGLPDCEQDPSSKGSLIVARLASAVRPRYHFCALEGVHYERLPYRNHRVLAEPARHTTRFIALAKVANEAKKKWLYAFTIVPLEKVEAAELVKQPPDVTECPFQFDASAGEPSRKPEEYQQYFYDMNATNERNSGQKRQQMSNDQQGNRRHQQNKKPRTLPPLDNCWFCLSSSHIEKHLVISIGDHNYLALPKGGLVPDHVLILPIGHCQSTVELKDEARHEIDLFKTALCKLYSSQQKTAVFFERNYKSHHLQIQVVPVPKTKTGKIKEAFLDVAEMQNIKLDEIPMHSNLSQIVNRGAPYFYVEIASTGEKLFHRIRHQFPLQFGREVLAGSSILAVHDKVDWRNCVVSKETETELAAEFRKSFQLYDFTLRDSSDQ